VLLAGDARACNERDEEFSLQREKKYSRAELTPRGPFFRIAAKKIIPVLYQRCGAPLDVADKSVRFVTCAHCSPPLEIVREAM